MSDIKLGKIPYWRLNRTKQEMLSDYINNYVKTICFGSPIPKWVQSFLKEKGFILTYNYKKEKVDLYVGIDYYKVSFLTHPNTVCTIYDLFNVFNTETWEHDELITICDSDIPTELKLMHILTNKKTTSISIQYLKYKKEARAFFTKYLIFL